ncbi:hypothetical protein RZ024_11965 [Citrobacter freundii]|uniref:Uncharacterized protein n=1 Tax=Citrobacter freundii TaxID=546 RepID=A0AAP6CQY0_CITFR|nr:hypothetical protein [Citrobacter freundii]MCW0941920.1 hypothetical protein [Citrobacter freundii]MDV2192269.1 hypothetical protein [Citrobacter freundii]MDW2758410.1 hypothetical protein [Citrobacter freundii]MEB0534548.1 hypothetical protein [Citrobacter freundii]WHW89200.1 hypothetical protein PXV98_11655 [Citrobacter freundii]
MDKEQYNTLLRFAHGGVTKESAIGLFVTIILDRDLLKSNHDVKNFVENVFSIVLLPYVVRSRTLVCAKICRLLVSRERKEINNYGIMARSYFENIISIEDDLQGHKKRNTALSNMDLWVTRMLKKGDK